MKINIRKIGLFLLFVGILLTLSSMWAYYDFPSWILVLLYLIIFFIYDKLSSRLFALSQNGGKDKNGNLG